MGKSRLKLFSIYHFVRLVIRFTAFLVLLNHFIINRFISTPDILASEDICNAVVIVFFIAFIVEMSFRFFPNPLECRGVQKQFNKRFEATGKTKPVVEDNNGTMLVAVLFFGGNAIFGLLHAWGIFDDGILIIISSLYAIGDIVCILFFCPFQSWFLKNRCCTTCRIYNWDFVMLFTPMFFVDNWYGRILLGLAFVLLLRWELAFYFHPERFSDETNAYLKCANCNEHLCVHKKSIRKKLSGK